MLWLAFRAWNAVMFVLIGASLGIVGCVLLGAACGAWPWDMSWLGDLGKLKNVGSEGAGGVEGHAHGAFREGAKPTTLDGAASPRWSGESAKAGIESGPAPSLPAKAQAGAPEPTLDGSTSVGACGKEGSPQPEGASASPAAASEYDKPEGSTTVLVGTAGRDNARWN